MNRWEIAIGVASSILLFEELRKMAGRRSMRRAVMRTRDTDSHLAAPNPYSSALGVGQTDWHLGSAYGRQLIRSATAALNWGQSGSRPATQISVCSEISRASSTSMPRYLTVDSSLECPSSSCTARRFFVRR